MNNDVIIVTLFIFLIIIASIWYNEIYLNSSSSDSQSPCRCKHCLCPKIKCLSPYLCRIFGTINHIDDEIGNFIHEFTAFIGVATGNAIEYKRNIEFAGPSDSSFYLIEKHEKTRCRNESNISLCKRQRSEEIPLHISCSDLAITTKKEPSQRAKCDVCLDKDDTCSGACLSEDIKTYKQLRREVDIELRKRSVIRRENEDGKSVTSLRNWKGK